MVNFNGPVTAIALKGALAKFSLDSLLSGTAILVYLLVIVAAVAILVFSLALGEPKELKREQYKRRFRRLLRSTVNALIVVAAIAALIATLVLPVLQIAGTSMSPSLNDGDIVVLAKTDRMETGDLCAFYYSNKILIKRVIATPGITSGSSRTARCSSTEPNWMSPMWRRRRWGNATRSFPIRCRRIRFL